MDLDRQAIERRDFPIGRRGYDPAAVDAHLRGLAAEFEELRRASAEGTRAPSLASAAASQVQSILKAAETAAADIERQAADGAREVRDQADRDAARTRDDAVAQAQAHVAAVAKATAILLERVSSMDGEVGSLMDRLRAGANRLAGDLAEVEKNMGELYDAASGRLAAPGGAIAPAAPAAITTAAIATAVPEDPSPPQGDPVRAPAAAPETRALPERPGLVPVQTAPEQPAPAEPAGPQASSGGGPAPAAQAAQAAEGPSTGGNGDLDGARLVALNMALNGESRADAERYLAENFKLTDRQALIDEVYAAIEG